VGLEDVGFDRVDQLESVALAGEVEDG